MRIERKRGDTYDIIISVVDADSVAIALTTETFILSVDTTENPTATADTFTSTGAIADALTGKVTFPIVGTTVAGDYFFDIQMVDTLSKIRTIAKGEYRVIQDITK